jgi:transcriptional regulator with GAF, ATPase, and Fis domain
VLPALILSIAQAESTDAIFDRIVRSVVTQPHVAMARVWLIENDEGGPVLRLRASAGMSRTGADWTRINGTFSRVELNNHLKLGHIARTGESVWIPNLYSESDWEVDLEWASREDLEGFAGHALVFRGDPLGVLATFTRDLASPEWFQWLQVFAHHAAVGIGNRRAFEEIDRLRKQLEMDRDYLLQEVQAVGSFSEILGSSPALNRVLRQVELVAPTEANVLILGESGTGKELVARAIHQRSSRSRRPLVKVNCGAIPHELFESEFFGHVKGAFTGAMRDRIGRFELANGGTLFLDEVGEIPLDSQAKLLRTLQEGEIERIGDDHTRRVDVRFIAATNRDLRKEVEAGRFRLDLYYRLGVFPLELPPLRERREDILPLATHFLQLACQRSNLPRPRLTRGDVQRLQQYDWPGNVRELQNVIERAAILARCGSLPLELPPKRQNPEVPGTETGFITDAEWRNRERQNLLAALQAAKGKISGAGGAADLLGINPNTLASRLRALGIRVHRSV